MSTPSHIARRLREALGIEAGDDLVRWMDETTSVRGDIAELRHELVRMEARLSAHIERTKSDLMKWSFMFWVGAVAAIAALAGVLGA